MEAVSTFCHLHVHSEYSLLDGAIPIADLVKKAKKMGHQALALTDHANMFGAIEFYSKCKDHGIKPILGAEIYWQGTEASEALSKEIPAPRVMDAYHLVLLARSKKGYHSLCRLVSAGFLETSPEVTTPVVSRQSLQALSEDIIALSSCLRGEFGSLIERLSQFAASPEAAFASTASECLLLREALTQHVREMQTIFGDGHYFIELIDNAIPAQKKLLPWLVYAARYFHLPIVASADSHYLNPEDQEAHAVLTGIKNELTMRHLRNRIQNAEFHLMSDEEMQQKFQAWPEALENQQRIADLCHIEFNWGEYFLPRFDLPSGETEADALRRLSREGLDERLEQCRALYGKELNEARIQEYKKRLEYEVEVIISMGFPGYFLIVQDFINWAKKQDIPVGPGRGSGAGSVAAWALKITDLDPLRFNLIFERFLNPERVSMPDFDVDFCQDRRDEVIRYVTQKYGADNVAQITTFGKMKAKAALRDVGRVLEIGYGKVDRIAKLIPNEIDIKLKDALAREPRILEEGKKDELIQKMIDLALKIEGMSRHTSVHAAGVVIAEGGMSNLVPVYKAPDGSLITQYEMKNAEKVGLVKFDFLGLKTLTVIQRAVKLVRAKKDPNFNIDTIDLERKEVYELISSAHSVGIFQLESSGMQALLKKLKPSRFEDIIAVVALFRPGPLGSGMVDDFIERKHGRQEMEYLEPRLEPILADTYGIILYQEQVQKIAAALAKYSLGEADLLRRAMGKKKPEEMAKQKSRFVSGSRDNGVDEKLADELFELMAKFAAYGFNKSHSAAYGLVSYQTAYLKTFYPEEFMAAIMTCDLDNTDKVIRYIEECRRLKFTLYPPDINRSYLEFDVPKAKCIGFGLAAIKGIGGASIQTLIEERERSGPFTSLTDLARRIDLHRVGKKTLELLIQAGALDRFQLTRAVLMKTLGEMLRYSEAHHTAKNQGQRLLFDDFDDNQVAESIADWEERARADESISPPIEWLSKEKKLLGVYLSQHPISCYAMDVKKFGGLKISDIPKNIGKKSLSLVAILNGQSERLTKTGKKMSYYSLEDDTGSWEAVAFESDKKEEAKIEPGSLVHVILSIQQGFDGHSINVRVENLQSLEQLRRQTIKRASISWQSSLAIDDKFLSRQRFLIETLEDLSKNYKGHIPVSLDLNFEKAQVRIRSEKLALDLSDSFCQTIFGLKRAGLSLSYS